MPSSILTLNAGSSSLKVALFSGDILTHVGRIERIGSGTGTAAAHMNVRDAAGSTLFDVDIAATDHDAALEAIFKHLPLDDVAAAGHRVVHGGDQYRAPVRVTPKVISDLERLIPLAPLHEPHNIAGIRAMSRLMPRLPQVACFDTAFHATIPRIERMFGLPREYEARGVKRYGFHGLSYEWIAMQLPAIDARAATGRVIAAHLGQGCSLCAMRAGQSLATTMGFTALDGLLMGTRAGAIDPGVLLHLLSHDGLNEAQLTDLLYRRSGLLGVSGVSADMRDLLASPTETASDAIELFCYRIAREMGALVAVLGGLDALVFTGGIGEHAAPVRERVAKLAQWLGLDLDHDANSRSAMVLHTPASRVAVYVIPANEEGVIVRHTSALVA